MGDEYPEVPFTVNEPQTHLYILTRREARTVARALDLTAAIADCSGSETALLNELRDRFAPEGLDA